MRLHHRSTRPATHRDHRDHHHLGAAAHRLHDAARARHDRAELDRALRQAPPNVRAELLAMTALDR